MFKVKLETDGLTAIELDKVSRAAEKMEMVFNSLEFKFWVTNFSYEITTSKGYFWNRTYKKEERICFDSSNGLTNYQVYNNLMKGAESLDPTVDEEADIFLTVDRRNKYGVIGYTYPTTKWQTIYGWVLKQYSIDFIAGNLAHEWCHKAGWSHSYNNTPTRQYSVPYGVGSYVASFK